MHIAYGLNLLINCIKIMSKPIVNQETCIGCGTCESICPAVFKIGGGGKAEVQQADYEENKEAIQEAIDSCPVQAISLGE